MRALAALATIAALAGCGADESSPDADASGPCSASAPASRTASCVASFTPGEGAGFGQDRFPEIVFGEPHGGGTAQGGLDVLSLGKGGEIVLGFGGGEIEDGDGVDLLVFENAFYVGGDPAKPYAEPGEVSVSEDGERWTAFPCKPELYPDDGCAGFRPVLAAEGAGDSLFDPEAAGGDPFDLADIGVARARFVRIRDVSFAGAAPTAGFDLDAVAVVHP